MTNDIEEKINSIKIKIQKAQDRLEKAQDRVEKLQVELAIQNTKLKVSKKESFEFKQKDRRIFYPVYGMIVENHCPFPRYAAYLDVSEEENGNYEYIGTYNTRNDAHNAVKEADYIYYEKRRKNLKTN